MQIEEQITYEDIFTSITYTWDNSEDFDGLHFSALWNYDYMINGHVKYDGCMNAQWDNNIHFCGNYMSKQISLLFDKIYEKAKIVGCEIDN
jgi:hypothetical protein